jgi:hypothetical protein
VDPDQGPEFFPHRFFQIRIMAVSGTKYTKIISSLQRLENNWLSIASLCFSPLYFRALLMDPDPAISLPMRNSYETESGSSTERIIDFKNDSKEEI